MVMVGSSLEQSTMVDRRNIHTKRPQSFTRRYHGQTISGTRCRAVGLTVVVVTSVIVVMTTITTMMAVVPCEGRYHATPSNAFKLPLLTGGIFGMNGDQNNNKNDNRNAQQQQAPKATTKMAKNTFPPPPPPPPPAGARRSASSSTPFVRGSGAMKQDTPPPPPQQQQLPSHESEGIDTSSADGRDRRGAPPPPPPPRLQKQSGSMNSTSTTTDSNTDPHHHQSLSSDRILSKEGNQGPSSNGSIFERESSASWRSAFLNVDGGKTNDGNNNKNDSINNDEKQDLPSSAAFGQPSNTPGSVDAYYGSQQQQQGGVTSPWSMNGGAPMQQEQGYYSYGEQQQQPPPPPYNQDPYSAYLQEELNESLNREGALITQLDNLTTTLVVMEQKDELHTRQLDVLTERVIDVEAQAAEDRLARQELELNCTLLQSSLTDMQGEVDQWQERCEELQQQTLRDEERLRELQIAVKEKSLEAEKIAMAIEELRLIEKRREAIANASHKPISGVQGSSGGGLFSWFWGLFGFKSTVTTHDDDDIIREEAFEMAKSTLLRALQTERSNVHELEAIVANLQQNNSAISEMVESRDVIINELNNRIAVFEEDKLVLKAALKQLQKEIEEEAPRTQKLIDDLSMAEQEISRLKNEIQNIIETHQEELSTLQMTISEKQEAISETESNLTAIGTYVDKLEERLTSFAVTRRDIEEREKKCKEIEKRVDETESQRKALEMKVTDFEKQEEELKKLLEELATERTDLQKENRKLYTEREFRIAEQEQLEVRCQSLEDNTKNSTAEMEVWKAKCNALEESVKNMEQGEAKAREDMISIQRAHSLLQSQHDDLKRDYDMKQEELSIVSRKNSELSENLANATKALTDARAAAALSVGDKKNDKKDIKDNAVQPPKPPPPPLQSKKQNSPGTIRNSMGNVTTPVDARNVPMRTVRKRLSKLTGLHGLITPSSKMKLARVAAAASDKPTKQPSALSSNPIDKNKNINKNLPPLSVTEQSRPVSKETKDPRQDPPALPDPVQPVPPFSKKKNNKNSSGRP